MESEQKTEQQNESKQEVKKRLSFATMSGCKKILQIAIAAMVVFCYFGYMMACNWGNVKVNEIKIDARGSIMEATLYTPRNVSSTSSLPAVIVTHGLSCNHSAVNGIAEELARRGFVALSLSTYGSGASETSDNSDPSYGVYDALQYVRTLKYVDQTRIGLVGHSQGSKNVSATVDMDTSLYTVNDLMINVLCDDFGQTFTKDEISKDADTLAKSRLSADQLKIYNQLKEEKVKYFNTRVKSAIILGGNWGSEVKTVKVGGYDVPRVANTNICYEIGLFNEGRAGTGQLNLVSDIMKAKFETADAIKADTWYVISQTNSDKAATSTQLGTINDISSASNTNLQNALKSGSTRIIFNQENSHARDYFSSDAAKYIVKYFEQTLSYNCGELTDAATVPLAATNIQFIGREWLDLGALISMCVAIVAFSGILIQAPRYKELKFELCKPFTSKKSPMFWILAAIMIAGTVFAEIFVAKNGPALGFKTDVAKHLLSLDFTANIHLIFMWVTGLISLALVIVFVIYNKKKLHLNVLNELKFKLSFKQIWKYFEMSVILFAFAYILAMTMKFFFHQDFRFWDTGVKNMLPQYFVLCLRYGVVILPTFIVSGLFVNAGRMSDMHDGWNTFLQMILSVIGLYVLAIISYGTCYLTYAQTGVGNAPSVAFISTWAMIVNLPLFAYLSRKFYNISGSIWLGAFVNTSLVTWMMCSGQSSTAFYLLTNFATKWLGIF